MEFNLEKCKVLHLRSSNARVSKYAGNDRALKSIDRQEHFGMQVRNTLGRCENPRLGSI